MDSDLGESGLFVVQTMNRFADELENVGGAAEQAQYVNCLQRLLLNRYWMQTSFVMH